MASELRPSYDWTRFSHPLSSNALESKLLADSIGIGKRAKNRHTYLRFVSGFDREEKSTNRFSLVRGLFGKATYHLLVANATKPIKFGFRNFGWFEKS